MKNLTTGDVIIQLQLSSGGYAVHVATDASQKQAWGISNWHTETDMDRIDITNAVKEAVRDLNRFLNKQQNQL